MPTTDLVSLNAATAASNTPAGTDVVGATLDNHLRGIKKNVGKAGRWLTSATISVASTTLADVDLKKFMRFDSTGGDKSLTLVTAAAGGSGWVVGIQKSVAANKVFINTVGSETINGASTITLTGSGQAVTVVCDGSNFFIKDSHDTVGVKQVVHSRVISGQAFTSAVPIDGTIPLGTEGSVVASSTASITPSNANNTLILEFTALVSNATAAASTVVSIHDTRSATASSTAIISAVHTSGTAKEASVITGKATVTAGVTTAVTYYLRCGGGSTTARLNGNADATDFFGAANPTSLTITEVGQ